MPHASSLWRGPAPLLLASTSPTRRALLESAGLTVETRAPGVDERAVEAQAAGLSPENLAERLAAAKAEAVAGPSPGRVVVGADQVLDLDGTVFHKPADRAGAAAHLARLQGRTHALHSAVALAVDGAVAEVFVVTARLAMRPLDEAGIAAYLDAAGPSVTGSVGAYQLEGVGIHLFDRIEGDHSTILGLPLLPLLARLRGRGLLAF
ncbi:MULTISPECIES: Maf family nucleotide pyrophosphatase [Methylobacterium]|jgi:septum formation protein|uniref:Maf family protein n=3 Tax=Methylobacteriaceae TaxID=119045 RepID=UPI0008EF3B12|nr:MULTISPECIES: Maf family nucleotide pyrophosphatase [Methylobacterium]MBK3395166.1 septum formation protein Maf [Methylobacterium ajmalii]MBK3412046.1 septum formation protein Maf [Methylobacterium ajmalii]MBZ6411596.1 Maf family nucleotide pyrophosphatase [Methylobacterium sp.]SFE40359.1 septum formation protein [Methylobacterium sp. yr596]